MESRGEVVSERNAYMSFLMIVEALDKRGVPAQIDWSTRTVTTRGPSVDVQLPIVRSRHLYIGATLEGAQELILGVGAYCTPAGVAPITKLDEAVKWLAFDIFLTL